MSFLVFLVDVMKSYKDAMSSTQYTSMAHGVSNATLISTFEMLVERLTALELKMDNWKQTAEADNAHKYGYLNPRAVGIDTDVFVHQPLDPRVSNELFWLPTMYYVKVHFDFDRWCNGQTKEQMWIKLNRDILHGDFDDHLPDASISKIKSQAAWFLGGPDCQSNTELRCDDLQISSDSDLVEHHVLDLACNCWVDGQKDWETVWFEIGEGALLYMTPSVSAKKSCNSVKAVKSALALLRHLGISDAPEAIEVGPLGKVDGEFLLEHARALQDYHHRDIGASHELKKHRLIASKQQYQDWKKYIVNHRLWKDEFSCHIFDRL